MFGLYIHIPFCKKACHYCDFHFVTNAKYQSQMVDAICKEIQLQQNFLPKNQLSSIYFGGGTPSILADNEIESILNTVRQYYVIDENAEITLEANPDDISEGKLCRWNELGINRLSLGVQSFQQEILSWMNRAHSSQEAEKALNLIHSSPIASFSVDLIYGYPNSQIQLLEGDIEKLCSFQPDHISAYHLTIEEGTVFGVQKKKGKLNELEESLAAEQFSFLVKKLESLGYEQYEISNFAKNASYAKHNTSYWQGTPYLGVGPSAHSFNKESRQHNILHNTNYMKRISEETVPAIRERLSREDKINEYIMTSLRTKWGTDLAYLKNTLNYDLISDQKETIDSWVKSNLCLIEQQHLLLTNEGKLLADELSSNLFLV